MRPVLKRPASVLTPQSWARLSIHTSLLPLLADPFPEAFQVSEPRPRLHPAPRDGCSEVATSLDHRGGRGLPA